MIDIEFFKEQCGESEELMQQMLDIFIQTAPDNIANIRSEFSDGNSSGLAKAVHAFLSSLKILNAEKAITLGSYIERSLLEGTACSLMLDEVNDLTHISELLIEEAKTLKS